MTRPRPFVLAVVTVSTLVAGAESWLRSSPLKGVPLLSVIGDSLDESTAVMHAVANAPQDGVPAVVTLGGSAMRDAFDGAAAFESDLLRASGRRRRVYGLSVARQSMVESLALATTLNAPAGSAILVHLSAFRLAVSPYELSEELEHPRLPFLDYSVAAGADATAPVVRSPMLVRARPWLAYVSRRRVRLAIGDCFHALRRLAWSPDCSHMPRISGLWEPVSALHLPPVRAESLTPAEKHSHAELYKDQLLTIRAADLDLGLSMCRRMVDLARARGWRIAFVQLPVDTRGAAAESVRQTEVDAAVRELRSFGADAIDLRSLKLPPNSFYDLHHLLPRGRVVADTLARWLAATDPPRERPNGR